MTGIFMQYHAEQFSITLETKTTDPQQPLQGNIGVKTRTVIVAPEKKGSNTPPLTDLGEAASVISGFSLGRKESGVFEKTDINSALITGNAAVDNFQLMHQIYDNLKTVKDSDTEAARHVLLLDGLGKLIPADIETRT